MKELTSITIFAALFAAGLAFFIAHPTPAAARNSLSFSPSPKATVFSIAMFK